MVIYQGAAGTNCGPVPVWDLTTWNHPGGSFVQIAPYRGRNIFQRNTFRDVGCFQIWGTGIETVVEGNTFERTAGLISWGQWRGWTAQTPWWWNLR